MPWLKKNLTLVVAGLVAVVLLGFSGYFLYSKMTRAGAVQQALDDQRTELERLSNLRPHPGNAKVDNIAAARGQNEQLKAQLEDFRETFTSFDVNTNLSSGEFSSRLLQTLAELRREAERAGVKLGTNFAFGFAGIKDKFSFEPKELPVHIEQLAHVRAISEALIEARVLTIDSIKRPAMPKEEEASTTSTTGFSMGTPAPSPTTPEEPSEDHWSREAQVNDVAVLHPYEITFQAFTPELGRFMDALARNSHCIVTKNLAVDTAQSSLLASPMSLDPWGQYGLGAATAMGRGGMDPTMAGRYGMGAGAVGAGGDAAMMARYGLGQMPGMAGGMGFGRGPVVRGNKTILLDEHPFRVRAWLYVVVPLPEEEAGSGIVPTADPTMADRYGIGR